MHAQLLTVERVARVVAAVCCLMLGILSIADIVFRSLRIQFFWASELNGIFMAWSVFLALPAVTRMRGHLTVDLVPSLAGPSWQRVFDVTTGVLMIVYVGVLTYYCGRMAWHSYIDDLRSSTILRLPVIYAQGGVVVGLVLMLVTQGIMLLQDALTRRQ